MLKIQVIKHDSFQNSSLVQILKSLTVEEMREFDKFVHSPFHNNRSEVTRFFDEIKKYYPDFENKDFSKEKVYSKLYPGKKYRDDVVRRLTSNLFKAGEDYCSYKMYRKDPMDYNKYL